MSALIKLAERVEAATGSSFLLEQEIADAVGHNPRARLPNYTASLDAAVTLVPEGLCVRLFIHPDEAHADIYRAHSSRGLIAEAEQAATPALALTAAALRARAAVDGGGE